MGICDVRETIVDAPPERVFELIGNVGGKNGWFYANFLWSARGRIDRLIGGVGMKRGRPRASGIETGDVTISPAATGPTEVSANAQRQPIVSAMLPESRMEMLVPRPNTAVYPKGVPLHSDFNHILHHICSNDHHNGCPNNHCNPKGVFE